MNNEVYKAGAYIRLSREDGNKFEESSSLKNQREIIKQYLKERNNITIYDYYADDGKSGTNFERPGFQRMIKDMYDKKIDCIIVKDLSRFGRNYIEVGRYIDYIFPTMNIRFIAINDNVDSFENPESVNNAMFSFKNIINDEYARDISRKVKKVKEVKRLNGEVTSGSAPYGYLVKDGQYVIDKEAAEIVKMIFDLYLNGLSTSKISAKLNDEKIDSPKVHLNKIKNIESSKDYYWYSSKISAILKCRNYIGELLQGKTTTLNNKVKVSVPIKRENWIVTKNHHKPIIDKDTFEKVQEKINENATRKVVNHKYPSIFKGYLKCYDCKKTMVKRCSNYHNKTFLYYDCLTYRRMSKKLCSSHTISDKEIKELVLENVLKDIEYLMNFEKNKSIEYTNNDELEQVKKDIKTISEKTLCVNKMINNTLYDLKSQLISLDDYNYYSNQYENELSELNKTLNELKDKEFMLSQEERIIKNFITKFKKYIGIDEMTEEVVKDLIDTIYIMKDRKISIKYIDNDVFELIKKKGG